MIAVRKQPAIRPKAQCHALLVLYVMKYLSFQLIFSNLFLSKFRCDSIHSSYLKWFDVSIHNPESTQSTCGRLTPQSRMGRRVYDPSEHRNVDGFIEPRPVSFFSRQPYRRIRRIRRASRLGPTTPSNDIVLLL